MQILIPVQVPNTSHAKPCAVNAYAREAYQQFKQSPLLAQAPNASHAKPYTCTNAQQFKQIPILGKPPDNSDTSLCQCRLLMLHTQILTLCRFSKVQTIPHSCAGFQKFT
ncbi:hypothetical protein O181_001988 [Austropuccinia psidii MF-1]|uniref:Uncharacterized protein n=1 Tax=Austropuccinia psidii MF-1 TaxID=1389203 RepID=A0A9Q3BBK4_9BASI|nr:hypothetical protein [Austropuccinia psidii MF-1]